MKKIIYSLTVLFLAAFTLAACEDVPAPYQIPSSENEGGADIEATGNGTADNPFNCAAALDYINSLEADVESDTAIYIKGKVVSIVENYDGGFGNATFYISDDGTTENKFYVYRSYYLNNQKYTSGTLLAIGDEVVIYGKVVNYKGNTPETVQNNNYLYSLNGNKGDGGSTEEGVATGDGTLENPFNSVAANQYASTLESGATSDVVYIKGKVVSIKEQYGTQYGNATFYISDDGTAANQFYVFRALYLNNEKYTSGTLLAVGDDVVICGQLTNYMGNTPETVQGKAYLYSLTSNGGGTGGDTGGEVTENSIQVTASALGIDNGVDVPTLTLSDGTTISFDGGGNKNTPKYYTSGSAVRMYPKNFMTITSSKTIKSVVLNCVEASNVPCTAEGKVTANPGTVSTDNLTVTIANVNNNQTVITNSNGSTGTASQLRWSSLVINYAE